MVAITARLLTVPQSDDELPRLLATFTWDLRVGEPIRQDLLVPLLSADLGPWPVMLELSRPVVEGPVSPAYDAGDVDQLADVLAGVWSDWSRDPVAGLDDDRGWLTEARGALAWLDRAGRLRPAAQPADLALDVASAEVGRQPGGRVDAGRAERPAPDGLGPGEAGAGLQFGD